MPVNIKDVEVRGLTRGEIKALRDSGIKLSTVSDLDEEERDAALDTIFAMACTDLDADSITPGQGLALFGRVVEATYLEGEQLKNSDSPQS